MKKKLPIAKVLLCQSLGFVAIIVLSWIDELLGLRTLILGDHPYISDFRESTLEMLFVLAVWLIIVGSTRRLLARVNHLEGFMRVCSWCRRIGSEGRWLALEEFMSRRFETPTSHGICEECLKRQEASIAHACEMQQRQAAAQTAAAQPQSL
jgi:hypothetical protein